MVKHRVELKAVIAFLLSTLCAHLDALSLEKPWFYPPYEFHIGTDLGFSFFSNVAQGFNPIDYHSKNIDWTLYAIAPLTANFDAQIEVNFKRTSKFPFNFETAMIQARNQIFNDIEGDYISLAWGLSYRYVSNIRLTDVATPYHNISNFEVFGSLGREFSKEFEWFFRPFLFAAVGQANVGYPWVRFNLELLGKLYGSFLLGGGLEGYFGTGPKHRINVDKFGSYADLNHESVDIYAQFGYSSNIWGAFSFKYVNRLYAKAFPEDFNGFLLSYDFPFSL